MSANTKIKRALRKQADELNAIIHRRNLYRVAEPVNHRVINAHVTSDNAGNPLLAVEDLYSGELFGVAGSRFFDGYGQEVVP